MPAFTVTYPLGTASFTGPSGVVVGGEEFVVVLPGMRMPRARQVADRLLELIRGWRHSGVAREHGLNVTASGGIASCTMGGSVDVTELLRMTLEVADRQLYAAKRAGKNRVLPVWHVARQPPPTALRRPRAAG